MPQPTFYALALATGILAAHASRRELRVSPKHALLSRGFAAYVLFALIVLVPVSVYFYVFHGDWSLLYLVDVRRIPSAIALVGFVLEAVVGGCGFLIGASCVRSQRESIGYGVAAVAVFLGLLVVVLGRRRLGVVGSYAQYHGGFGLQSFSTGALLQGTLLMSLVIALGIATLLVRLHFGSRRGA